VTLPVASSVEIISEIMIFIFVTILIIAAVYVLLQPPYVYTPLSVQEYINTTNITIPFEIN
jgi:hypothetical protein